MQLYKSAILEAERQNIEDGQTVQAWIKVAKYEYYRGNTENAIKLALQAIHWADNNGDRRLRARLKIFIGDLLRGNNLYEQAEMYLSEALVESAGLKDSSLLALVFNRMAASQMERHRYTSSKQFGRLSLHLAEALKNDSLIYNNLNILGVIATSMNDTEESIHELNRALDIASRVMPDDVPLITINLARNYDLQNKNDLAIRLNKEALSEAEKLQIPQYIRLAALNLNSIYIKLKDYKNALNYDTIYYRHKEIILNQKVQVQLTEFKSRLAAHEQTAKNQILVYEKQLTENRLNDFMILGFLMAILLLVLTGFLIQRHYQHKKTMAIARQLDQSNLFLKRFISILAHDLRSPFTTLLGYSDLLLHEEDMTEEERKTAYSSINKVSQSAFTLLERLLEWSRLQAGTLSPNLKQTDIGKIIEESIENLKPAAALKNITIQSDPFSILVMVDPEMIRATFRNLISNALKFTPHGGTVSVDVTEKEKEVHIRVTDNGMGIAEENLNRIFQPTENITTPGTQGEKGSGLGLMICL